MFLLLFSKSRRPWAQLVPVCSMSLRTIGGAVLSSLGPSLAAQAGGAWSSVSFRPIPSLLQTMVPAGYTALQEERLAMVDLGTPKPEPLKNGFHREPRRHSDRSSRTSISLSDAGDGCYAETEPMLPDSRLSGEEADKEEESEEEGQQQPTRNMPKESPLAMALQILVPFLLAGFGTVSAGVVLDIVQVRFWNFKGSIYSPVIFIGRVTLLMSLAQDNETVVTQCMTSLGLQIHILMRHTHRA